MVSTCFCAMWWKNLKKITPHFYRALKLSHVNMNSKFEIIIYNLTKLYTVQAGICLMSYDVPFGQNIIVEQVLILISGFQKNNKNGTEFLRLFSYLCPLNFRSIPIFISWTLSFCLTSQIFNKFRILCWNFC